MDPLVFLGSKNIEAWRSALPGGDDELLQRLAFEEPPAVVHLAIMSYINNMYMVGVDRSTVIADVGRVHAKLEAVRRTLGPQLREIDLGLMRDIRRSSKLSVVLGAGATMAAGGPSWSELVQRMLNLAIESGQERTVDMALPLYGPHGSNFRRRTAVGFDRFEPSKECKAREILALIEAGEADTEALMQGAQLCYDLFGQDLFTQFHSILYQDNRQPSETHRAIATLAYSAETPDRGHAFSSGWDCIISYNFDDLMGEAIDAERKPRAVWAMRGDKMVGDPNELAEKAGQHSVIQNIYHLHGYTPRRMFKITHVKFVFSTSQFKTLYPRGNEIIDHVYQNYLSNPIHHVLYIGCSFEDDAMNALLRDAWQQWPGRWHYALLKWHGPKLYRESAAEEINEASNKYTDIGVQPVWFDKFGEIPGMIRSLE